MCSRRVSGFLTELTQQIHSLRASGVNASHIARALGSDDRDRLKSCGRECATPPEIFFVILDASGSHFSLTILPRRNGDHHTKKKNEERDYRRLDAEG